MSYHATQSLKGALEAASLLYYRLVLLVGPSGSGKTKTLAEFTKELKRPVINLNLELSAKLLESTPADRAGANLLDILRQIVESVDAPVLLDNIEILFDRSLKCDPLKLLQGLSRNRAILASWNGDYEKGRLRYAESGHPEYRNYEAPEAIIVHMRELAEDDL